MALIGPLANRQRDVIGSLERSRRLEAGGIGGAGHLRAAAPGLKITYAKGANIADDQQMIDRLNALRRRALEIDKRPAEDHDGAKPCRRPAGADVVVAVVGESQGMTGEAAARADINAARPAAGPAQGPEEPPASRLVLVLMNGRPLALSLGKPERRTPFWKRGFRARRPGNAIADVLFGDYNPSRQNHGYLSPWPWARNRFTTTTKIPAGPTPA